MSVSLEQAIRQIVTSTIMTLEEIDAVLDTVSEEQSPVDGGDLIRLLVNLRKLTIYQSQQILKGRGSSLVFGNYVILDRLGKGGMGVVLKAEHRRMRRIVALKVFSNSLTSSPAVLRRFQREVEAIARLEHPNIVVAHDADEVNGTQFLVMQYVEGTDLQALVKNFGPLPAEKAVSYALQAAIGLEYAHARGIIHRDIKPANLLLDRKGTIKILDMGLARSESADLENEELTETGQVMGTADYMAPEQALDTKTVDARADIYSLGATLWYLLSGKPIHAGDSVIEKLQALKGNFVPSLRKVCPEATEELECTVARMIAKNRDERYQSMAEVIVRLQRTQPDSPWMDIKFDGDDINPDQFEDQVGLTSSLKDFQPVSFHTGEEDQMSLAPSPHDTFATVYNKAIAKTEVVAESASPDGTITIQSALVDTDPELRTELRPLPAATPDVGIEQMPVARPRMNVSTALTCGIIVVLLAMVIFLIFN